MYKRNIEIKAKMNSTKGKKIIFYFLYKFKF